MADNNESQPSSQTIQLKDPLVAGVLAWLIPGLGHFYQGRNAKGALYAICILGTFLYGLYLGGSKEVGWGRAVYFSFRTNDWRLPLVMSDRGRPSHGPHDPLAMETAR